MTAASSLAVPATHISEAPSHAEPIAPQDRVELLDVLRGFALFGVLWSNLNQAYGRPTWQVPPANAFESVLLWIQIQLIGGRFYTILGFVFGVGFAIQLRRAESRGVDGRWIFYRRMFALLIIGVIHGTLVWSGDILTTYALLGFVLAFYRRLSARQLLVAAAATYFVVPWLIGFVQLSFNLQPPFVDLQPIRESVYPHGTYVQIMTFQATEYLNGLRRFVSGANADFLTLFVIGLWADRAGALKHLAASPRLSAALVGVGVAAVAIGAYIGAHIGGWLPRPTVRLTGWALPVSFSWHFLINRLWIYLKTWGTAASYVGLTALLLQRRSNGVIRRALAAVGRMPLTTYLTQSVICTLLFYGYGLGWYGRVGLTGKFEIALLLFAGQAMFAMWWTARFAFGPFEWLWRSAAYWRLQRLKYQPRLTAA